MSARASLFVGSLLWGISLSLFAYRFGVLPFVWHSPLRIVFPGVSIGLFVGALQIVRMRPKEIAAVSSTSGRYRRSQPLPMGAMLGLFALGFAPTFAILWVVLPPLSHSPLMKRELPGFSIALPKGETASETIGYPAGSVMLERISDGSGVVIVSWEPGGSLSRDELRAIMPLFAQAIAPTASGKAAQEDDRMHSSSRVTRLVSITGPDRKPLDTVAVDTDGLDLELSLITCGVRHVIIATAGRSGVMALHQRIVTSFACHPDSAQEATATSLAFPLALDLPGWHLVARDEEVTQISSADASLVLRTLPPAIKTPDLATFIGPAFEQTGAHVEIVDKNGSDFIKVKLEDQGDTGMGWVALFRCPTGTALVLGLGHDDATVTALYAKIKAARCLKSGEKPTEFPAEK